MVFQVSSNCRMFMLANALVQASGCVPDIICVAQITLKFVDYALVVDNRRLLLFRGEDLTDLFWLKEGSICTPIVALRFRISLFDLFPELADWKTMALTDIIILTEKAMGSWCEVSRFFFLPMRAQNQNWPISRKKKPKNRLVCKNAVT